MTDLIAPCRRQPPMRPRRPLRPVRLARPADVLLQRFDDVHAASVVVAT
jgi:hypothetical protein